MELGSIYDCWISVGLDGHGHTLGKLVFLHLVLCFFFIFIHSQLRRFVLIVTDFILFIVTIEKLVPIHVSCRFTYTTSLFFESLIDEKKMKVHCGADGLSPAANEYNILFETRH